jgi:hypothetical protein
MLPEFITPKIIYIILHLFGVAIGAGGAYFSGFIFMNSLRDGVLTETEIRFLKLASKIVWAGVAILVISGALIFLTDTERYLSSAKFLSKMTVVAIIIINGFLYHIRHMPKMVSEMRKRFELKENYQIFISGAVSLVSWTSAVILGSLRGLPYSYGSIMLTYIIILLISIGMALIFVHTKRG